MKNTEEKPGTEATANELTEEKLGSVSGGVNSFAGLPVSQLIADPIQEVVKSQATLQRGLEIFLKATPRANNK